MATTIAVFDSLGRCIGRCDAKCHNAENSECTCICQGANHGVGLEAAYTNTEQLYDDWVGAFFAEHPEAVRADVYDKQPVQLPLFDVGVLASE